MNTSKTTPKDFFLHLGLIISLYAGVISLINLAFDIINHYFPDAVSIYSTFGTDSIRWSVSMIIVLFPIAFFIKKSIFKESTKDISKREIWINKWRIYLSMFLTGATIIVDLIVLINTYLGGEISTRFILKVISIFIISGILFIMFLFEKKPDEHKKSTKMSLCIVFGIIILTTLIMGFVSVGSPTKQRALRFDAQRVSDLQSIQYSITNYWQQKGKLPVTLKELEDPLYGTVNPVDPENKSVYPYSVKDKYTFELCANFSLESTKSVEVNPVKYPVSELNPNWQHSVGRTCFERVIDPQKYPVNKSVLPVTVNQ